MPTLQPVYSIAKTRASLIGAAILSGIFTLDLFVHLWASLPFGGLIGAVWTLVAIIGSPIGSYRGALKLQLGKPAMIGLTLVSFIPPVGLIIHLILLFKLPKE